MTNRDRIYLVQDDENLSTFQYDKDLPSLPLPKLKDTMERYFQSLKPFGNNKELNEVQKRIADFQNGIGKDLHFELEKRSKIRKNWLEGWWEDYAYHLLRIPLYPYTVMGMPFLFEAVSVPETHKDSLRVLARVSYYSLQFWDIIRREKLRPASTNNGEVKYSSKLFRHFFSTVRLPGEEQDKIISYFLPVSEGEGPHNGIVLARGRIFKFDCLNEDKSLLTPQQLLNIFEIIRARVDSDDLGDCVPVLTADNRTNWAKNRDYLHELSSENVEIIKEIEKSILTVTFDDHEPSDYSEVCTFSLAGDFHSKWCDKTSGILFFRNGRMGGVGEHSAYDGTISITYDIFVSLSLLEFPEPNWDERPGLLPQLEELHFVLDDHIKSEIERMMKDCEERKNDILVSFDVFHKFGKEYLKTVRIHPDAFFQTILQLVYYKLHNEFAPTYETALMRHYYNGRTETLRSCTTKVTEFIKSAVNIKSTKMEIFEKLKIACEHHMWLMEEARKGNGIDRHLFGLWCIAYEKGIDIPDFYSDPMYLKSGGGGNFVLSTSTLGYTACLGYVAPMVIDGYGVFYSFTNESMQVATSVYSSSKKTSAKKFNDMLFDTFTEIKEIIDEIIPSISKL
ncbi:peroxisomal carnitine O-octanoyltransferase [Condylostylus longicornis]|uniref:peroxisomal carnitine O-octanoyltransferase n=1 Tax=Condylostylus longicornis TaxID=2530218 RepID=UPI00244E06D1|nr:peroxisomal carnitine O-octanoyltransferase [Condylostylus longicornis]XP_055381143.1 peroxisomal carnitine O-octanoyltransferase [Condylostylus longicornis]XP_055381144.1 peroxisomal carnitine O-octanoyltransferase [Condylostylus longicornis]XP_055381145.1 peroxisomal carnitine O-octanoyltransferase [Condylostylus longicornis]XP_055381146.1 peroxisomal carnitine O-octanoyltransferase [Condylostylus longicornis]XP_055381148.1 peroxisomal carnitine O-octanoyltransferase [Condylostylus longic